MAARDPAVAIEAKPGQDIAAESFGETETFANLPSLGANPQRALRQPGQNLLDQDDALLDFADPDPDARIDVAAVEHRNLELESVVGRIGDRPAGIEGAAAGAAHIAAGPELACQGG